MSCVIVKSFPSQTVVGNWGVLRHAETTMNKILRAGLYVAYFWSIEDQFLECVYAHVASRRPVSDVVSLEIMGEVRDCC
jgi:hypothetical protein